MEGKKVLVSIRSYINNKLAEFADISVQIPKVNKYLGKNPAQIEFGI